MTRSGPAQQCGRHIPWPLKRCRRRTCPGYAAIWAGDQRQKLSPTSTRMPTRCRPGLSRLGSWLRRSLLPGWKADGLGRAPMPSARTTSALGRPRLPVELARHWNQSAAARWRDMHRAAYQRCRREGLRPWLLLRVWELQRRGLLHAHPVLAYSTVAEKAAADRYLEHLDDLRHDFGFGYVERKHRVREPRAAAAYLSSYFIGGKRRKRALRSRSSRIGCPAQSSMSPLN